MKTILKSVIGIFILFFLIGFTNGIIDKYSNENLIRFSLDNVEIFLLDSTTILKVEVDNINKSFDLNTRKISDSNIFTHKAIKKDRLTEDHYRSLRNFLGGSGVVYKLIDFQKVWNSKAPKMFIIGKIIQKILGALSGYSSGYYTSTLLDYHPSFVFDIFLNKEENWEIMAKKILMNKIDFVLRSERDEALDKEIEKIFNPVQLLARELCEKYQNNINYNYNYKDFDIFK